MKSRDVKYPRRSLKPLTLFAAGRSSTSIQGNGMISIVIDLVLGVTIVSLFVWLAVWLIDER